MTRHKLRACCQTNKQKHGITAGRRSRQKRCPAPHRRKQCSQVRWVAPKPSAGPYNQTCTQSPPQVARTRENFTERSYRRQRRHVPSMQRRRCCGSDLVRPASGRAARQRTCTSRASEAAARAAPRRKPGAKSAGRRRGGSAQTRRAGGSHRARARPRCCPRRPATPACRAGQAQQELGEAQPPATRHRAPGPATARMSGSPQQLPASRAVLRGRRAPPPPDPPTPSVMPAARPARRPAAGRSAAGRAAAAPARRRPPLPGRPRARARRPVLRARPRQRRRHCRPPQVAPPRRSSAAPPGPGRTARSAARGPRRPAARRAPASAVFFCRAGRPRRAWPTAPEPRRPGQSGAKYQQGT